MGAGTPDDGRKRRLLRWEARHDNGWTTIVAEQPDRTFAACVTNGETSSAPFVDSNVAHAHAAVMAELRRKSGHRRCSSACSDWLCTQSEPTSETDAG